MSRLSHRFSDRVGGLSFPVIAFTAGMAVRFPWWFSRKPAKSAAAQPPATRPPAGDA